MLFSNTHLPRPTRGLATTISPPLVQGSPPEIGAIQAPQGHSREPEDGRSDALELHEVEATATGRPQEFGGFWLPSDINPGDPGSIAPGGDSWHLPLPGEGGHSPEMEECRGMGLVRSEGQDLMGLESASGFGIRLQGWTIASRDGKPLQYRDEIIVRALRGYGILLTPSPCQLPWPSCAGDAGSWPSLPPSWDLNMHALPFRTRDLYAELKRIFYFFSRPHPEEDAEWLLTQWHHIMDAVRDVTSAPHDNPDEACLSVIHFCRAHLPVGLHFPWMMCDSELTITVTT